MKREILAPGTVFQGRYEVVSFLAEDGPAMVYKGRQLGTGQLVAVKVMHLSRDASLAELAQQQEACFRREIRFCARLHHPNIIRLIDSGRTDEGQLYTVFVFVPGQNLAERLTERGALEPHEAKHLMLQVLDALGCAHDQGVVHGDLKPANIMVVPTGARPNAVVLDFGVGAVTASGGETWKAGSAGVEGKSVSAYAAPEQLRGFPPTVRSDLYSWALVFIECLAGRPVFAALSREEPLERTSSDQVRIPAVLVGHPLGAILQRATANDITVRANKAGDVLRDLEVCDVDLLRRDGLSRGEVVALSAPVGALEVRGESLREAMMEEDPCTSDVAASPQPSWMRRAPQTPVSGQQQVSERRPLTVVCCVLTTTGARLASLDNIEEIDELFHEVQEVCAKIARRHHGDFAGALGDQVLLHFGLPKAEEDDPRRAARAALAIAAEIRARSARLESVCGVALDIRIGIHTGIVTAREAQANAHQLGMTTQIAARLSALAPPSALVVSGDTYRILRGSFDFEATGTRVCLGSTQPLAVYRLREGPAAAIADSSGAGQETTRLFGREQEIELLMQRWSQTRAGTGQSIVVTGEAGIGKSRLVKELARRLQGEPHLRLECRCTMERRYSALHPIVEVLERLLETGRFEGSGSRLERLESLLARYNFHLEDSVPLFAALLLISLEARYSLPEDSPRRQKERTLNALLSLVFEATEEQPVALIVEDVQWADAVTIEWLGALVAEVPSARMMALLVARPEFSPPWPTSSLLHIQLGRLDPGDVERIARQIAGGRSLPDEVIEQVVGHADGVPLFVEELTQMVLESKVVREEGGRYALAKPLSALAIPDTLRGLLVARLDRLGRAKETAQIAAALGREFRQELLCAVSPLAEATVQEHLSKLSAADLVHSKRRAKSATYVFKHALIRDAAYESLPRGARRRVHARIARVIEERFPETVRTRPDVLVRHYAAAEQKQRAIVYAERAAELAIQRPDGRADENEAVAHITQALGWLAAISDERERTLTEMRLNDLLILAQPENANAFETGCRRIL